MSKTTKVVNETSADFFLKEGTAGVYRLLRKLKPRDSYKIKVDPNATYREYWFAASDNDPKAIIFSSDDCQDYKEVRIKEVKIQLDQSPGGASQEKSYTWDGDRRDGRVDATQNPGDGRRADATQNQGDGRTADATRNQGDGRAGNVVLEMPDVAKTEPGLFTKMWKNVTGR